MELSRIVFIGRTYEEYEAMFALSSEELKEKKILDCPAGACSFTAVGAQKGLDVTACDIAYYHAGDALFEKGKEDVLHAMDSVEQAKDQYVWEYFSNVEELRQHRTKALSDCAAHMAQHPDRYVAVTLPELPFEDNQFDVILSAHFLFTYADRLDHDFHLAVLDELLRTAREEIRLFPLVDLSGKRYEHLGSLIDRLRKQGHKVEEIPVLYEFQRNANTMMKICKRAK